MLSKRLVDFFFLLSILTSLGARSISASNLKSGDIVVADLGMQIIQVDPVSGEQILISAGGLLEEPYDVAFDANGDILVAVGYPASSIVRVNPETGNQSVVSSQGLLNNPHGVVTEAEGKLLVADFGAGRIIRVDTETGNQILVSSGGYFGSVRDITIDAYGDILVVIQGYVILVDPDTGEQSLISSGGFIGRPSGIAVEANGDILVADSSRGNIIRIDPVTGTQNLLPPYFAVGDVAIEANGDIIASDRNRAVHRINPLTGVRTTLTQEGHLVAPHGIAIVPASTIIAVYIDIKPGSDPNCFNLNGHGVIPVAINGTDDFDVGQIEVGSLKFDGLAVRVRGKKGPLCSIEDWNNDGEQDMVCHFEDDPAYWTGGDATATLTGELIDGTPFEGTDSICIVQEY
jgi:streptogramin lyase